MGRFKRRFSVTDDKRRTLPVNRSSCVVYPVGILSIPQTLLSLAGASVARSRNMDCSLSKKSPSKAFYVENPAIMSSIMVNSKIKLNTVVYDSVVSYLFSLKRYLYCLRRRSVNFCYVLH